MVRIGIEMLGGRGRGDPRLRGRLFRVSLEIVGGMGLVLGLMGFL